MMLSYWDCFGKSALCVIFSSSWASFSCLNCPVDHIIVKNNGGCRNKPITPLIPIAYQEKFQTKHLRKCLWYFDRWTSFSVIYFCIGTWACRLLDPIPEVAAPPVQIRISVPELQGWDYQPYRCGFDLLPKSCVTKQLEFLVHASGIHEISKVKKQKMA